MTRQIEDEVAENSRGRRRVETQAIDVSGDGSRNLSFGKVIIDFDAAGLMVRKRDIESTMVMGHPRDANGMGRGSMGDMRGSYSSSQAPADEESAITRTGREAIAGGLAGKANTATSTLSIGTGSSDPSFYDTALETKVAETGSYAFIGVSEPIAAAYFPSTSLPDAISEVGLKQADGGLLARNSNSGMSISQTEEAIVSVMVTFRDLSGDNPSANDLAELAGKTMVDLPGRKTITRLGLINSSMDTIDTKRALREVSANSLSVRTYWVKGEPPSQPVTVEGFGVHSEDGIRYAYSQVKSFTKDSSFPIDVTVNIHIT